MLEQGAYSLFGQLQGILAVARQAHALFKAVESLLQGECAAFQSLNQLLQLIKRVFKGGLGFFAGHDCVLGWSARGGNVR